MGVSVIVTTYNSPDVLLRCLAALQDQPHDEIIVADCSEPRFRAPVKEQFPAVTLLTYDSPKAVPMMRWDALRHTRHELVLATEGRCVPAANWVSGFEHEHRKYPNSPAIGGGVVPREGSGWFDWGLFFCEYGHHIAPLDEREVEDISGANLSYKRATLVAERDLLEAGAWETRIHRRWRNRGLPLRTANTSVAFWNTMTPWTSVKQRFHYGRGYAATRHLHWTLIPGILLLPAILVYRTWKQAAKKGLMRRFLLVLPWVAVLTTAWSAGELAGYLLGAPRRHRIY